MATLKISELSVGDWVEINHEVYGWNPAQINVCGDLGIGAYFKDIDPEEEYDCCLSEARPIPITAEILEKNGWSSDGMYATLRIDEHRHLEYYFHEHRLCKYYCGVDEWQNHAKVTDITFAAHCYSVHQLQHALRLAGVDKEINL